MNRYALTCAQTRAEEERAFAAGVSPLLLMEHAAEKIVDQLEALLGGCSGKRVLFACGSGNNGGDGLAAARLFAARGGLPSILLPIPPATVQGQAQLNFARYLHLPVLQTPPEGSFDGAVDALFGIGLNRAPTGALAEAIDYLNTLDAPVLAVDVPSGMNGDTGRTEGACVHADRTVSCHAVKTGLLLTPHPEWVGVWTVADIGLPPAKCGLPYYEADDLPGLLPPRAPHAHKGLCGRVLVYGGSEGKAGAAAMCALAALKGGAGLVTVACSPALFPILQTLVPNAMCAPLSGAAALPRDVLAAGCGIGQSEAARQALLSLLPDTHKMVLDADGLNLLAQAPFDLPPATVLTPHPLEAARLLQKPLGDVLAAPLESAHALCSRYGCTVVLKNAVSVIAAPDGRVALNVLTAPSLAKGGSGDALCGLLAATLCEMDDPFEAARIACLRLSVAGRKGAEKYGVRGLLTCEMAALL